MDSQTFDDAVNNIEEIQNHTRLLSEELLRFNCNDSVCDWEKVRQELNKIKSGCLDILDKFDERNNEPTAVSIADLIEIDEFKLMDCERAKDALRKTLHLFSSLDYNDDLSSGDVIIKMIRHFAGVELE